MAPNDTDSDLKRKVLEADWQSGRAAFLLCERHEPESVSDLVKLIGKGTPPEAVFDAIADGYAMWTASRAPISG